MVRSTSQIYNVNNMIEYFMKSEQEHFVVYILNHCFANDFPNTLVNELLVHMKGSQPVDFPDNEIRESSLVTNIALTKGKLDNQFFIDIIILNS